MEIFTIFCFLNNCFFELIHLFKFAAGCCKFCYVLFVEVSDGVIDCTTVLGFTRLSTKNIMLKYYIYKKYRNKI